MRRLIVILLLLSGLVIPAHAQEIVAPAVPDSAQDLMPPETESFGEGLWYVIKSALQQVQPEITAGSAICLSALAVVILVSIFSGFSGVSKRVTELAGTVAVACLLLGSANTLIDDAVSTVTELSEYGKLLVPVMATALAAQGGVTGSAAIYSATAMFDALLCGLISGVLVPLLYAYIALAIGSAAIAEDVLKRLRDFIKWLISWVLKTAMYLFTGYITITGVVCGTTDQAALKAAKLTISSAVPVVGGILSDASEAVLVSAGVVKNAVGIYGFIAVAAIAIGPFLRIGIQYLLVKLTAAICGVFGNKKITDLVGDFSTAMGFGLAMTGTICLILMISLVCFMKGVGT